MPYALIPDGYTLKKVTKAQLQAVSAKRRHDNVEKLLVNPTTPIVAGGAALLLALPLIVKLFWDALELENIVLSDSQKRKVETGFRTTLLLSPFTAPFVVGKEGLDILQEQLGGR